LFAAVSASKPALNEYERDQRQAVIFAHQQTQPVGKLEPLDLTCGHCDIRILDRGERAGGFNETIERFWSTRYLASARWISAEVTRWTASR